MLFAKESLPDGPWPMLFVVERCFRSLEEALVDEVDLTEGLGQLTISGRFRCYKQLILRRALETTQAVALLWSHGLELPAVLTARALYETIASFYDFLRSAKAMEETKNYEALGALVDGFIFSTRDRELLEKGELQKSPHILNQIRAYDAAVQAGSEKFYDRLSDACHPNGYAMLRQYGVLDNARFLSKPAGATRANTFTAIYNSVYQLCWFYTAMADLDSVVDRIQFLPE